MAEALNPAQCEQAIADAANEVARGIGAVSKLYDEFTKAEYAFDQAWAKFYTHAEGPVEERKQKCVMKTADEAEALRAADVAYKYGSNRLKAAEARMSAYQSILKSVMMAYQSGGTNY